MVPPLHFGPRPPFSSSALTVAADDTMDTKEAMMDESVWGSVPEGTEPAPVEQVDPGTWAPPPDTMKSVHAGRAGGFGRVLLWGFTLPELLVLNGHRRRTA